MTDSASQGSLPKPSLATQLPGVASALLIGAVAYVARLVPVVRGAGLRGMNSYDGAVYYAAAAGLAHRLLPYRDFLFLHPPGIVVALDQLRRPRSQLGFGQRLTDMVGLTTLHAGSVAVAAVALAVAGCVLAVRSRQGQLAMVVLLASSALQLSTPPWFVHNAGPIATPAAVMVGAAAVALIGVARSTGTRGLIASLPVAGLAVVAMPILSASFGRPFPAAPIAKRATPLGGCVTTDDARTLIQTDLLQRNFQRACRLVVDLGGYSYDIHPGTAVPRSRNRPWQRFAIDYLRSGSAVIVVRFNCGFGFSAHSASVVQRWPVLLRAGHVVLRSPVRVDRGS